MARCSLQKFPPSLHPPPLPLSSLHSSGPREICIMSMSRGLFGRRKEGGRIVALLMSLPDIRDAAFQRKILPHTVKPSPRGTLLLCFNAELGRGPWRSVGRYPMGTARGKLLAKELKRQLPSLEKGRREFECPSAAMGWDETAARPIPVSAPWT